MSKESLKWTQKRKECVTWRQKEQREHNLKNSLKPINIRDSTV